MACALPLRILALRSSQACQDVEQLLSLKLTIASPPPQACAETYLRAAPARCAFSLRLTRTYPRAASSTFTLLTSWRLRTAFIISTFTLRLAATYSHVYITHINALAHCLGSQAPSHPAALLTIALTSPSHLFTLSHYLFSHGVENRKSTL